MAELVRDIVHVCPLRSVEACISAESLPVFETGTSTFTLIVAITGRYMYVPLYITRLSRLEYNLVSTAYLLAWTDAELYGIEESFEMLRRYFKQTPGQAPQRRRC